MTRRTTTMTMTMRWTSGLYRHHVYSRSKSPPRRVCCQNRRNWMNPLWMPTPLETTSKRVIINGYYYLYRHARKHTYAHQLYPMCVWVCVSLDVGYLRYSERERERDTHTKKYIHTLYLRIQWHIRRAINLYLLGSFGLLLNFTNALFFFHTS